MRGSEGLPEVNQPPPPMLSLLLRTPQQIQPPQVQPPYTIPLAQERKVQLPFATIVAPAQIPYAIPLAPSRQVRPSFTTPLAPPQQSQPPSAIPLAQPARQFQPLLALPLEPPRQVHPPLAIPPVPSPQQNQQGSLTMVPPRNLILPSHHQQRLRMFWQNELRQIQETGHIRNNQLPVTRIKKIVKMDETVNMISSEVPILFSKACELFICDLTLRGWLHTEDDNRRTLQRNDISSGITRTDHFDFLIDIVPRNRDIETNDYRSLSNNNIYGDGDGDTTIEGGQDEMLQSDDSSDNGVTIAYNPNIGITDVNDGGTIAYPGIDRENVDDDGVTIANSGINRDNVDDGVTIAHSGIDRSDVYDGVTIAYNPHIGITNVNASAGSSAVVAERMYQLSMIHDYMYWYWYQLSMIHDYMINRYVSDYQQYLWAMLGMSSEEDDSSDD